MKTNTFAGGICPEAAGFYHPTEAGLSDIEMPALRTVPATSPPGDIPADPLLFSYDSRF